VHMFYTLLYTKYDGKSYFKDIGVITPHAGAFLGKISDPFSVSRLWFRDFCKGAYDWHTVPQKQWIVYLCGKVCIETSGGEIRYFGPGHILYATDTDGKGHRSTIIEEGRSLIVTADIETQDESLPHGTGAGSLGVGSNVRGDIV
jgi:hypothetical protein